METLCQKHHANLEYDMLCSGNGFLKKKKEKKGGLLRSVVLGEEFLALNGAVRF